MGKETNRPVVGYLCPSCGFDTDMTHCDDCNAIVKWDSEVGEQHTALVAVEKFTE